MFVVQVQSPLTAGLPLPTQPKGRLKAKLLLLTASLTFTFVTAEMGMRIARLRPRSATVLSTYFQWDAKTGWRGRPNAECRFTTMDFDAWISHGAEGFRRGGYEAPLAADRDASYRVVWCVGDSMTWGWGVDDGTTFVDCLNRHSTAGTRYRNLGHPGFSSIQEYLLLKELFAAGYCPDQVLILFCINDLRENVDGRDQDPPRPYLGLVDGTPRIANYPTPRAYVSNGVAWLKNHSLVCNYTNYYAMRAKQNWRAMRAARAAGAPTAQMACPPETCPPEQQRGLEYAYGRIRDLCHEHKVEFCVASEFEVHPALREACRKLEIPLLDLSLCYARHAQSPNAVPAWHFQSDPHYTEFGHRLVAQGMREQLQAISATVASNEPNESPTCPRRY